MTVAAPAVSFSRFLRSGLLLSDRGEPLRPSPLTEALAEAIDDGSKEVVISCPRRSGKSSVVAQVAAWFLMARPLSFVVSVAPAMAQAEDLLHQKLRIPLTLRANVAEGLTFAADRISNPRIKSAVQVVACSDITGPGRTISALIVDEARGVDAESFEVLRPSAAGGLVLVLGSPGSRSSWWYDHVHSPPEGAKVIQFTDPLPLNPSLDAAFVANEKARLARRGPWGQSMAAREWCGEWTEITSSPLILPSWIERASVESVAPFNSASECTFTGVDLSVTGDLTSILTVAKTYSTGAIRVIDCQVIDPKETGPVSFEDVESRIMKIHQTYRPRKVLTDQYQAVALAQRLQVKGVVVESVAVTAGTNMAIFSAMVDVLEAGRLTWSKSMPSARRLEAELRSLSITETLTGFRVTDSDRRLHRDVSFALALAVREAALDRSGGFRVWISGDDAPVEHKPRSKAEIKADVASHLGFTSLSGLSNRRPEWRSL